MRRRADSIGLIAKRISAALLLSSATILSAQAAERRAFVGYFPSWFPTASQVLADTPKIYTHIVIAFSKPDLSWNGENWSGTGLQFKAAPDEIRQQIQTLHQHGTRVLLAVGGATYLNWKPLAAEADRPGTITKALAKLVVDMGFDGLDVDYEPDGAEPATITEYGRAIKALRHAVDLAGPGKLLSLAAWSTGADCTAETGTTGCGGKLSTWTGGRTGRERLLFRDKTLFHKIAMISVMSYDAGVESFDPVKAWSLYRDLVPSRIIVNIGLETAPEGWGGAQLVANDADARCAESITKADQFGAKVGKPYSVARILSAGPLSRDVNPRDGAMLWHILKDQNLPRCGDKSVVSPRELELTARVLPDRQRSASPAFSKGDR